MIRCLAVWGAQTKMSTSLEKRIALDYTWIVVRECDGVWNHTRHAFARRATTPAFVSCGIANLQKCDALLLYRPTKTGSTTPNYCQSSATFNIEEIKVSCF